MMSLWYRLEIVIIVAVGFGFLSPFHSSSIFELGLLLVFAVIFIVQIVSCKKILTLELPETAKTRVGSNNLSRKILVLLW